MYVCMYVYIYMYAYIIYICWEAFVIKAALCLIPIFKKEYSNAKSELHTSLNRHSYSPTPRLSADADVC